MFFTGKQQERVFQLEETVSYLERKVEELLEAEVRINKTISAILVSQQALREAAYGLKKDGTPRSKPGRKAK